MSQPTKASWLPYTGSCCFPLIFDIDSSNTRAASVLVQAFCFYRGCKHLLGVKASFVSTTAQTSINCDISIKIVCTSDRNGVRMHFRTDEIKSTKVCPVCGDQPTCTPQRIVGAVVGGHDATRHSGLWCPLAVRSPAPGQHFATTRPGPGMLHEANNAFPRRIENC